MQLSFSKIHLWGDRIRQLKAVIDERLSPLATSLGRGSASKGVEEQRLEAARWAESMKLLAEKKRKSKQQSEKAKEKDAEWVINPHRIVGLREKFVAEAVASSDRFSAFVPFVTLTDKRSVGGGGGGGGGGGAGVRARAQAKKSVPEMGPTAVSGGRDDPNRSRSLGSAGKMARRDIQNADQSDLSATRRGADVVADDEEGDGLTHEDGGMGSVQGWQMGREGGVVAATATVTASVLLSDGADSVEATLLPTPAPSVNAELKMARPLLPSSSSSMHSAPKNTPVPNLSIFKGAGVRVHVAPKRDFSVKGRKNTKGQ